MLSTYDQKRYPVAGSYGTIIANRFFSSLLTVWFNLSAVLSIGAFLAFVLTPHLVFASNDEKSNVSRNYQTRQLAADNNPDHRPPSRIPPRAAIEACDGKKEGEHCTFINSADGILAGECLSGVENVFACRPYRGVPTPATIQNPDSSHGPEPRGTRNGESKSFPEADKTVIGKAVPSPSRHSGNQVMPPEQESPPRPIQSGSAPRAESLPPAAPLSLNDHLKQYGDHLASYLVVAIMGAGLTWYIFFRYVSVPLRRLRKVTQQLADGDLSARVGEGLVRRRNEVVKLGGDVDRMAERIESLVGAQQRLIRDVSHELRSPLARLNVALELARQSAGSAHAAPFDRIERESERLNELIGQLLMLTKLESDSGMAERIDFDITALVAEIAQDVDFEARGNDRIVTTTTDKSLQLKGNRELLRQALENLIRNAVRYTAPGTAVDVSLCSKESGGRSWAHIEVRDQGPGVPEAELQNIFRPFYRVNDARDRQSGGAGVGLAISDRAVRLHGGNLRAMNAPSGGLIMELELPLK